MWGAAAGVTRTPRLETRVWLLSHLVTQLAGAHISGSTSRVVYHKDRGEKEGQVFLLTNCCPPGEAVVLGIHDGGTQYFVFSNGNVMAHTDTSYHLQSCGKHSWDLALSSSVICKAHKNVWIINLPLGHFFLVILPKIKISCPRVLKYLLLFSQNTNFKVNLQYSCH